MKTIQISEENAIKAFNAADEKQKELLINLLGKDVLNVSITDRVKTFEDACKVVGIDYDDFIGEVEELEEDEICYKKIKIIAEALNEGWKPDWSNSNQNKYMPYFRVSSGGGFSFDDLAYWYSDTYVGSRLCYKSSELAQYAGNQFISEYKGFLTIK